VRKAFRRLILCITYLLLSCSCTPKDNNDQNKPEGKVKAAVKEVVTKDFDLYKGAKDSLKESEQKHKSELEQIDKELK
jgi:hypothetical protein